MTNSTFEDFISKIKKIAKKPKNSKYYKKFLHIAKKQKEKLQKGKHRTKKQEVGYVPYHNFTNEKLINTTDISSDDSGISNDNSPGEAPVSVLTKAFIEPLPAKFLKNDIATSCEAKNVSNENKEGHSNQLESGPTRNKRETTVAYDENNETTKSITSRRSNSFYRSCNDYSLLPNWNRTSLNERNQSYGTPPKKPPRLHLKANDSECFSTPKACFQLDLNTKIQPSLNKSKRVQPYTPVRCTSSSKLDKTAHIQLSTPARYANVPVIMQLSTALQLDKSAEIESSTPAKSSLELNNPTKVQAFTHGQDTSSFQRNIPAKIQLSTALQLDKFAKIEPSTSARCSFSPKSSLELKESTKVQPYTPARGNSSPKSPLELDIPAKIRLSTPARCLSPKSNVTAKMQLSTALQLDKSAKIEPSTPARCSSSPKSSLELTKSTKVQPYTPARGNLSPKSPAQLDMRANIRPYTPARCSSSSKSSHHLNVLTKKQISTVLQMDKPAKIQSNTLKKCPTSQVSSQIQLSAFARCLSPKSSLQLNTPAKMQSSTAPQLEKPAKIQRSTTARWYSSSKPSHQLDNPEDIQLSTPEIYTILQSPPKLAIIQSSTISKYSNSLNTGAKIQPSIERSDFENAISDLTSTLKSQTTNDSNHNNTTTTCSSEVYSKFKDGLTRKRSLNTKNDTKDDKFVVNLFESRQSKRWKRQSLPVGQIDKISVINDPPKEMIHKKAPVDQNEKTDSEKDEIYFKMKKMRDIECGKMKEASNALWTIRNSAGRTWTKELLAESILLETELRYKAIVNKIREAKETEEINEKVSGGITLSNFQFQFVPPQQKKTETTTFFVLAVSNNTEILTTKPTQASGDNKIVFNETFSMKSLSENFQIRAEVFSITLNTAKMGIVERLLRKKTKCCYPRNKIYFENVNTFEMQESSILKPSFTSCGEFTITKADLGSSLFLMPTFQVDKIKNNVTATISVDYVNLNAKLSGFLTLGKMDDDKNIHHWERKWCSLINNTFSIYNYPQDEEFDRPPEAFINLEYCFIPVVKNPKDCPRKRTFIVKTGRPSTLNDSNGKHLRRKNNFILNKYYLSADSKNEFDQWTQRFDTAIEELDAWGRLIFKDDYYL